MDSRRWPITGPGRGSAPPSRRPNRAPEALIFGDPATSDPASPRGRVELVTFLRPITRLDILLDGDPEPVMIDLASNRARGYAPGAEVAVRAPPEAIRILT